MNVLLLAAALAAPKLVATLPVVGAWAETVLGAPVATLLEAGLAPHDARLRPSQARALAGADLVVWIGPELETPLAAAIERRPPENRLALLELDLPLRLPLRRHGAHDHAPASAVDPHAWLAPPNARVLLLALGERLAALDPGRAAAYRERAAAAAARVAAVDAALGERLAPFRGRAYASAHDHLQYFERHYGLVLAASLGEVHHGVGPHALRALHRALAEDRAACLVLDPTVPARLARALAGAPVPVLVFDPTSTPDPADPAAPFLAAADAFARCFQERPPAGAGGGRKPAP